MIAAFTGLNEARRRTAAERKIHDQTVELLSLRERVEQLEVELARAWKELTPAAKQKLRMEDENGN